MDIGSFLSNLAGHVLGAVAIVVGGILAISFVVRAARVSAIQARVKPALIDLSIAGLRGIGLLVILSGALQSLGLDQIALAIGGSISLIALGVATAASGNLGDIIAGVFLASDPDFGTGFTISTNNIVGVIEHVDLRKTRLRTADGKLHVLPNKLVEGNDWIVEARPAAATPAPLFRGIHNLPNFPSLNPLTHRSAPPAGGTSPSAKSEPGASVPQNE